MSDYQGFEFPAEVDRVMSRISVRRQVRSSGGLVPSLLWRDGIDYSDKPQAGPHRRCPTPVSGDGTMEPRASRTHYDFREVLSASNLLGRIGEHELLLERVGEGEDLVGLEEQVLSALPGEPVGAKDLLYLDDFDIVPVDALLVPVQEEAVAAKVVVLPEGEGRVPQSLRWSMWRALRNPGDGQRVARGTVPICRSGRAVWFATNLNYSREFGKSARSRSKGLEGSAVVGTVND